MQHSKLIVLLNPTFNERSTDNLNLRTSDYLKSSLDFSKKYSITHSAASSLYASSDSQALLGYYINPDQDLNPIISKLRAHYDSSQTEWRIYEPLTDHPVEDPVPLVPHILIYNAMSIDPESEEDFNNWYNHEHIPLLSQTPSWLYSRRYTLVACSHDDTPRYLALHSWPSREVFDSPAYKLATETPWRARVLGKLTKRQRIVFDYADNPRAQGQAKSIISTLLASV